MSRRIIERYERLLAAEKGPKNRKDPGGRLTLALLFPNLYRLGMANLGFQTVYALANSIEQVACERAFLPDADELADYRATETPLLTIESQRRVLDFHAVAFSLCFENDHANVPRMLSLSGLPLLASERDGKNHPLIIGGGVASMLNPEPLAPFFDLFWIGEAEAGMARLLEALLEWGKLPRPELLERLAREVPGTYVPSLYSPRYLPDGRLSAFEPQAPGIPERVQSQHVRLLDETPAMSAIRTPSAEFGDITLIEVGRGCPRGCRFCAAGYVYRPPRAMGREAALSLIAGLEPGTSCGLVSAAASDWPVAEEAARLVAASGGGVQVSSLRADSLSAGLLEALKAGGARSIAIAPEAGSERLRGVINKGLTQEEILRAADLLADSGLTRVKLYFMVGLPTEDPDDIQEIIALVRRIKHQMIKRLGAGKINPPRLALTVASFVPKPHTPFQFAAMLPVSELKERIKTLERALRKDGVSVTADVPKYAYLQAVLARGDRRVSELLLAMERAGSFGKALREVNLNADFYALRDRGRDELLPWDFIDHGVRKEYLWEEWQRALAGKLSPACRVDICRRCGVCG